jgi:hypothetical protein
MDPYFISVVDFTFNRDHCPLPIYKALHAEYIPVNFPKDIFNKSPLDSDPRAVLYTLITDSRNRGEDVEKHKEFENPFSFTLITLRIYLIYMLDMNH